jgi:glycine cleavage system H protein
MAQFEQFFCPADRAYDAKEHLWVELEDGRARIGIDELGREAAGTVSFLDLHAAGKRLAKRGAAFGTLEANKFVGALRTPIRGVVLEVNRAVLADPSLVSRDPYGAGWFVVVEPSHLEEDLAALVRGEDAITDYLASRVAEYRERGILPEEPRRREAI